MKRYKLLYLLILVLGLVSCDLDKEPYGLGDFWKTEADVIYGLNAAYAPFYEEEAFGRGYFWTGPASDDMIINRDRSPDEAITEFRTAVNSTSGQYSNWKHMYQIIRRTNDVMKHAPLVEMSSNNRDVLLGEANFICAFSYFYLAKRYGGLPFYDYRKPLEINKARETKEETFLRIENYLKESIKHFEAQSLWKRDDKAVGRPHLGAAYGLLAKVYAHWGKFEDCKQASEKVIQSNQYSLNKSNNNGYSHLFSPEGEKHEEVLFNLVNRPNRNEGTITSIVLMSKTLSSGTGWYYFAPTKSLYDAFETGDLRRRVTLVGAGDEVNFLGNKTILTKESINDMRTGYMCTKYAKVYEKLAEWNWESGADIPLLRYSDVLLLHAESIITLAGGDANNRNLGVANAASSFNEVRLRAFGGDLSKAIAQPTFMDLVNERRCELAYEDERHYDLVRWQLAKEIYASATTQSDPRGPRTFDPIKDAHFPLPQKEIELTGFLLENNPKAGYSSFK
ncbi:membrane protein [Bacteroidales bacterium]|nr:membrane protein [Bacteroidales bacterium]